MQPPPVVDVFQPGFYIPIPSSVYISSIVLYCARYKAKSPASNSPSAYCTYVDDEWMEGMKETYSCRPELLKIENLRIPVLGSNVVMWGKRHRCSLVRVWSVFGGWVYVCVGRERERGCGKGGSRRFKRVLHNPSIHPSIHSSFSAIVDISRARYQLPPPHPTHLSYPILEPSQFSPQHHQQQHEAEEGEASPLLPAAKRR